MNIAVCSVLGAKIVSKNLKIPAFIGISVVILYQHHNSWPDPVFFSILQNGF